MEKVRGKKLENRQEEENGRNKSFQTVIHLSVNRLKYPDKRHSSAEWIFKNDLSVCCLQETHFLCKDTNTLKVKGWKDIGGK